MGSKIDLLGKRFGRLLVIKEGNRDKRGEILWVCKCDCTGNTEVLSSNLRTGNTTSCGCKQLENNRNQTKGREDSSWKGDSTGCLFDYYSSLLIPYEEVRRATIDGKLLECCCTYCGRWFVPTRRQINFRLSAINGFYGTKELRLYCDDPSCKTNCPIFGQIKYPKGYKPATSREVQPELRKLCFARDNYTCIKCGATENLHCHHIEGILYNPLESADLDLVMTVCKSCHKDIHNQKDCRYVDLQCKKEDINEISY